MTEQTNRSTEINNAEHPFSRRLLRSVLDSTGATLLFRKIDQTRREEWPRMTVRQKLGAVAATSICLLRAGREIVKTTQSNSERGWGDTIADVAWAASDGLDGMIARKTGGATAIGGVSDQLVGDKYARWAREAAMAKRGRIHGVHVAVRLARDMWVTQQREKITTETGGILSVDASPKSDPLSGKYSTTHYLISNTLLDSPLGQKMPRWTRETLATAVDVHLIATGIASVRRLQKLKR